MLSVATENLLSSECVKVYLARAQHNNGLLILGWLCSDLYSLTCCYLVWYLFLLYMRMLRSLVLCKGLLLLKSLMKQEMLKYVIMCCSCYPLSFVFELRRCGGIRRCTSNTPMNSSICYFICRLARLHLDVLVCLYTYPR